VKKFDAAWRGVEQGRQKGVHITSRYCTAIDSFKVETIADSSKNFENRLIFDEAHVNMYLRSRLES